MKYKLKDVFDLQMGKTPSRHNVAYWGGNNKWISIADIGNASKYIYKTKETISDLAVEESGIKIVPTGTVIMSFKLSIGKTCITSEDMYTNEAIMAFVDKGACPIDIDYFYHFCCGRNWSVGTNKAVLGLTLNKATLSEVEIDIPNIEVQREIAQKLDSIDDLIKFRRQELDILEQIVKSRFIEMFGDVINNDRNWPMATMGDVAEIKIGPFGTLLHKEDYIVGGHALVNPSHIVDGKISVDISLTISDEKYEELTAYHLKTDDIVLGRRGEMGRCAVVREEGLLCGTGSLIIRPNDKLKPYFLQTIISNPTYKKIIEDKAVGVTMMNLNVPIVESLRIPMLPIELQNDFIFFMEQVDKSKFYIIKTQKIIELLIRAIQYKTKEVLL